MANTNYSVLWHWTGTKAPELPAWVTTEMYNGRYVSKNGFPTAILQSNASVNRSGKVTNGFMKALLRARMIRNGTTVDGFGKNHKIAIAEMTMSTNYTGTDVGFGELACVTYDYTNGDIRASKGGQAFKANETAAPIFLAVFAVLMGNGEFSQKFDSFCNAQETSELGVDTLCSCACFLADYVYAATSGSPTITAVTVPQLPLCASSQISKLSETTMKSPKVKPFQYWGNFQRFPVTKVSKTQNAGKTNNKIEVKDFVDAYIFSTNKLTPEQEKLVPKLDAGYVIHDTLITCCQHIKATTGRPRPIRNILLRGEPGTGKSETYVGIAAGCHLPLYTFAANAMTEPFDLFGQFVPIDENTLSKVLDGCNHL